VLSILTAAVGLVAAPLFAVPVAEAAGGTTTYTVGTPGLDRVSGGPWTLSQGDPSAPQYASSYPTYTPGAPLVNGLPNLAVYPAASAPPGPPYASGAVGTPGPLPAYCSSGGSLPESGTQASQPAGLEPMSPYYFPFVTQNANFPTTQGDLTGYFDYRPKDTEEEVVAANSSDGGQTWTETGKALEQNPENDCPTGDTNDNGQGHAFIMTVGGTTYLYTLPRPAGDNLGVGLLVHPVNPAAANPLSGLPAVQSVGTDPDTFANGATSGGTTIAVTTLGTGAETVGAGQFEDLNASATLITCTATGTNSLTGCTASAALSVAGGDALVQVFGDATTAVTIPAGPNNAAQTGGVSLSLNAALSAVAVANIPGRFYVDGSTVYCINVNGAGTQLQNCTTTKTGGQAVAVGDAVTSDPIVPAATPQTNGLVAPDGIVGVLPDTVTYPGAPDGSTVVIYGEKILNYYVAGTLAAGVTLPASTITMTPSASTNVGIPATGSFTIYLGTTTGSGPTSAGSIQAVTCSSATTGATDTFSGCTGGVGVVASGNDVGGPGAAIAPPGLAGVAGDTLAAIGEGSAKPKTLFKNNEDYTVLRAASTTDGINFTDLGAISGSSGGAGSYTDVSNPSAQATPATMDLPQGATDTPELRYVGTRGTIIVNPDGSLGMFDSGAWQSDGDSDAFNQIFYTSSTDGVHWSEPTVVESTDYTFSGRQTSDANTTALGVGAYFGGRAYSPTLVQNPDKTLTMVFSGYSTPKPIPLVGAVLGNGQGGAPQWTVTATDPALYRSILTVTLTPSPNPQVPESPFAVLLPISALVLIAGAGFFMTRRRRRHLSI